MPLTAGVKRELLGYAYPTGRLRAAEIATLLRFADGLHIIAGRIVVEVTLDSKELADRVQLGLSELFNADAQHGTLPSTGDQFVIRVQRGGEVLSRTAGLVDAQGRQIRGLSTALVNSSADTSQAVWRGAFLAAGQLLDPGRTPSLEVTCPSNEAAMALVGTARRLGVSAKAREIRNSYRVVIRDPDEIAKMLRVLGAFETLEEWEEARKNKESRNSANRLVNFDDANLRRSAQAAVTSSARAERALEILGDNVPEHLRYAGILRIEHRAASLDELGRLADPPLTKDAVAGRIRRLLAMADRRASDLGIPDTMANVSDDMDDYLD